MKTRIIAISIAALVTMQPSLQAAINKTNQIRFGSVTMDTPAVMYQRLKPLTAYLSEKLGLPVSIKVAANMSSAINEIAKGNVELAYLTPVAYIRSHQKGKTRILVKAITKNQSSFQLMIFVREDSPIKTIEDLAGKRFAFGDKKALLQRATVVGAGMSLEKLGSYDFLGHPRNILLSVLHNDFDAGVVKDTEAYIWEDKGIRILYASPQLPPFNIAVASHVDDKMYQKLRDALLLLDANKPKDLEVLYALDNKYNGFAAADDKEYDIVRKLIAPFQD